MRLGRAASAPAHSAPPPVPGAPPPGPPVLSPGPGSALHLPRRREAVPQCGLPRPSGATRSGFVCRAPSCRPQSGPCPPQSAEPWRRRSGRSGGRPGEAPPRPALRCPRPWCCPPAAHPPPAHRMKSLEQDALRAQMVLSKSQEGRSKRGPLERLAEAPSPAPTPSPTPLEGL